MDSSFFWKSFREMMFSLWITTISALAANISVTNLPFGSGIIQVTNETLSYSVNRNTFVVFSTIHGEEAEINLTATSTTNSKDVERLLGFKMKNAVFFEENGTINISAAEPETIFFTAFNGSAIPSLKGNNIGFVSGKTTFLASSNKINGNSVSMKLHKGDNIIFVERNPEFATINKVLAIGNVTLKYYDVNGVSINESAIINASNFVVVANITGKKSNVTVSISITPSQEQDDIYYKYTISTSASSKIVEINENDHHDHHDHHHDKHDKKIFGLDVEELGIVSIVSTSVAFVLFISVIVLVCLLTGCCTKCCKCAKKDVTYSSIESKEDNSKPIIYNDL